MRWKLFTLLAVLALMVATASPVKVKAQGLVEYALILVLVALGPGELGEINWGLPGSSQGKPQGPSASPGDIVVFTYVVTNTGDSTCTKTFSSSVEVNEGINTLNVSISGEEFSINGVTVGFLEPCPTGGNRNAIAVGHPFPHGFSQQDQQRPDSAVVNGFLLNNELTDFNTTIVDSNGATVATSSRLRRGRPIFFPIIN